MRSTLHAAYLPTKSREGVWGSSWFAPRRTPFPRALLCSREKRGLDFRRCRKWGFFTPLLATYGCAPFKLSAEKPSSRVRFSPAQSRSLSTKGVKSLRSQSDIFGATRPATQASLAIHGDIVANSRAYGAIHAAFRGNSPFHP